MVPRQDILAEAKSEPGLPSFESLVSPSATVTDVCRDIQIFDPRVSPVATKDIDSVMFLSRVMFMETRSTFTPIVVGILIVLIRRCCSVVVMSRVESQSKAERV
jgi:hypothetical protein